MGSNLPFPLAGLEVCIPPNRDVHGHERNVRFTSTADLAADLDLVRFPPFAPVR